MKPGFFIDRPVFSTVLSILIVLVGLIGLIMLPIEQYPSGTAFSAIFTAAMQAWFLKVSATASPISLSAVTRRVLYRSW